MLDLHTPIAIPPSSHKIEPGATIITLGSCFATALSNTLGEQAFSMLHNPFGTLYTPSAITTPLLLALHPEHHFTEKDLYYHKTAYHALAFASRFHDTAPALLLKKIQEQINILADTLQRASHIIITLGTAWQYHLESDHTGVGNCHKLPHKLFTREYTPPQDMISHLSEVVREISEACPRVQIIFTVSPVRHMRNNPLENSRSKAALVITAQEMADRFENVDYFPSYEIMMDELRDYRFYEEDMTHPTPLAQDIIFERFSKTYLSTRAQQFIKAYKPIRKARHHILQKPTRAQKFGQQLLDKIIELEHQFQEVSLEDDKNYFASLR